MTINCACVLKYEHSSCNHLYNQLTRKELLNHLTHFLFCPTRHADSWMTSTVYIDKYAPYCSSLRGLVAFLVVQTVTVRTLKGGNRFCLLLCEREGSVVCFPLQWEEKCSCREADASFSCWLTVLLSLRKVAVMEDQQGPWIADRAWNFGMNSIGEQE